MEKELKDEEIEKIADAAIGKYKKMLTDEKWVKKTDKPNDIYTMDFEGRVAVKGVG